MTDLKTRILDTTALGIRQAADLLLSGAQVAFPTETVYGLGADATNAQAVAGIYAAKGRPSFNPLIVHVADVEAARDMVEWSDQAEDLAQAFWPGPFTMVLPLKSKSKICDLVTAGLPTLAIRVPQHPIAQKILKEANRPIAAPSANASGKISPTSAQHVLTSLDGRISAVVDGGDCTVGLESTILHPALPPVLLRPGAVTAAMVEMVTGLSPVSSENDKITAPGQLLSHYAPSQTVRLNAVHFEPYEASLGFGDIACDVNLSHAGDLTEAATQLFGALHKLDAMNKPIAVSPIPDIGLGAAINDRLKRAAAPRDT